MKAPMIATLAAGTVALATAGYFANEWRVCRALERDYLEEATSLATDLQTARAMEGLIDEKPLGNRIAANLEKANRIYYRIKSRCGVDRAEAIQRESLSIADEINKEPE